jgi:hypothetical protein
MREEDPGGSASGRGQPDAGRSPGRGFGPGRGRGGRFGAFPRRVGGPAVVTVVKFKGRCKDLETHVYDYITPSQAARDYKTTTSKLAEYVGRTYERGVDVQRIISDGVIDQIKEPEALDSADLANTVKKAIWDKTRQSRRTSRGSRSVRKTCARLTCWSTASVARGPVEAGSVARFCRDGEVMQLGALVGVPEDGDVLLPRAAKQDARADRCTEAIVWNAPRTIGKLSRLL